MPMRNNDNYSQAQLNNFSLLVADNVHSLLGYWDNNEVCRFANSAYLNWLGRSREEMVNKITVKELLGPIYKLNAPYIIAVLQGTPQHFERVYTTPSGEIRNSYTSYIPHIADGEVKGFIAQVTDITPIKKLDEQLSDTEIKLKEFLYNSPIAMVISNDQGIIQLVSNKTETLFGYSIGDLIGQPVENLQPVRLRKTPRASRAFYRKSNAYPKMVAGSKKEMIGMHKDGTEFPIETTICPV